jgi:catechol 2,3-dioxygenase-like lactoylglutathione lyase family enzyme
VKSPTYGLSHIALKVADLDRAVAFYQAAFGARQYFRNEGTAQILGPGPTDVIAFELMPEGAAAARRFLVTTSRLLLSAIPTATKSNSGTRIPRIIFQMGPSAMTLHMSSHSSEQQFGSRAGYILTGMGQELCVQTARYLTPVG